MKITIKMVSATRAKRLVKSYEQNPNFFWRSVRRYCRVQSRKACVKLIVDYRNEELEIEMEYERSYFPVNDWQSFSAQDEFKMTCLDRILLDLNRFWKSSLGIWILPIRCINSCDKLLSSIQSFCYGSLNGKIGENHFVQKMK